MASCQGCNSFVKRIGLTIRFWDLNCALLFAMLVYLPGTRTACTLPSDLAGSKFFRPTETEGLTFTSTSVDVKIYFNQAADPLQFSCDTKTGDDYIFKSATYSTSFANMNYYFCWRLVQITSSAYMLYELSETNGDTASYGDHPGVFATEGTEVPTSDICKKDANTVFWTTLVKEGATATDVATQCPSMLQADFTYDRCGGSSSLAFCPDLNKGTADYSLCSTQIFQSTNGVVYCMGSVTRAPWTYINLYIPEKGKDTVCWKIQSASGSNVDSEYFTGDCTTNTDSTLALTYSAACSTNTGGNGGGESTTEGQGGDGGGENATEGQGEGSSGGGSAGIFAGAAIGALIALALVALLLYCFVIKGKAKKGKVSDIDSLPSDTEKEKETKPSSDHSAGNGSIPDASPKTSPDASPQTSPDASTVANEKTQSS